MITQNSEVYNPTLHNLSSIITHVVIWKKDLCIGGIVAIRFTVLFPYFLLFWYPYILLHFEYFSIREASGVTVTAGK